MKAPRFPFRRSQLRAGGRAMLSKGAGDEAAQVMR